MELKLLVGTNSDQNDKLDDHSKSLPPLLLKDGQIYEGQWKNCMQYGTGKMYLKDGCFIYGEWRQGELMRGLLIYPNGDFYEGSFSKQQIDGMGVFESMSGYCYDGKWANNMMHHRQSIQNGSLAKYSKSGVFTFMGEFAFGMMDGIGTLQLFGVFIYQGEFFKNSFQGKGSLQFLDQTCRSFEGIFQRNYKHGYGIFKWPALNSEYSGTFVNDKKHGLGKMTFLNGIVYEGNFSEGEMHGNGTLNRNEEDSQRVEVQFDKGVLLSDCTYTKELEFISMSDYEEDMPQFSLV